MHTVRRTKPCPHMEAGKCTGGKGCPFLHGATAAVAFDSTADLFALNGRARIRLTSGPRNGHPSFWVAWTKGSVADSFGGCQSSMPPQAATERARLWPSWRVGAGMSRRPL